MFGGQRDGEWSVGMCRRGNRLSIWAELCLFVFVFGGQRDGDSLIPSGALYDQHALQRGFWLPTESFM